MKKLFILLISIVLFACSTSSDPDQNPKIYLSPGSSNISVSDQLNINIIIEDNQESVFGVSMQIGYDNASLNFVDSTGFTSGTMFSQNAISFAQSNGSVIHISLTQLNGQNATEGSGTVGTISLNAVASGNSVINILQDELYFYDSNGDQITISDLNIESASISIQ